MAVLLTLLAIIGAAPAPARVAPKFGVPRHAGPRESCVVDAPSAYEEQARRLWCDAPVDKVSLRTDTRNYIAQVYLSPAGQAAWRASAIDAVAPFRKLVNDVARLARMNVAVTIRGRDGAPLATCKRGLIERAAACAIH